MKHYKNLDELVAALELAQASLSSGQFSQRRQGDNGEADAHFPNEQDDLDPEFDHEDDNYGPTKPDPGVRFEDDEVGAQQSGGLTGEISGRIFEPGQVQLRYLPPYDEYQNNIERLFLQNWTAQPKPFVQNVFLVLLNSPGARQHENEFNQFEGKTRRLMPRGKKSRKFYVTSAYHGTHRKCILGDDPSQTNPCSLPNCSMCLILKGKFLVPTSNIYRRYGKGIYTSTTSDKTKDYTRSALNSTTKAVFLCSVITGRKRRLTESPWTRTLTRRKLPRKYDSVIATTRGKNETIVYSSKQIKPLAVIVYSEAPQTTSNIRPLVRPVNRGIYTIENARFHDSLQLDGSTNAVYGQYLRGEDAQLWIFEEDSGGWAIRNKAQPNVYLGYKRNRNSDPTIVGVDYQYRSIWRLRKTRDNMYRIALQDDKTQNIALDAYNSNNDKRTTFLVSRNAQAHEQLWFLDNLPDLWNGIVPPPTEYQQFPYDVTNRGIQVQSPVHNGVYMLVNNHFENVMDLARRGGVVFSWQRLYQQNENQKWIFEHSANGWLIKNKRHQMQYLGVKAQIDSWKEVLPVGDSWRGNVVTWDVKKNTGNTVRISPVDYEHLEVNLRGTSDHDHILLWNQGLNTQVWRLLYLGSLP